MLLLKQSFSSRVIFRTVRRAADEDLLPLTLPSPPLFRFAGGGEGEWYEIKDDMDHFPPRRGSSPSCPPRRIHPQNAKKKCPHATTELASVGRCSLENTLKTSLHADEPHGDEVQTDSAIWF